MALIASTMNEKDWLCHRVFCLLLDFFRAMPGLDTVPSSTHGDSGGTSFSAQWACSPLASRPTRFFQKRDISLGSLAFIVVFRSVNTQGGVSVSLDEERN